MVATPIHNEFIDFLAGVFSPQQIVNYKPSEKLQNQAFDFIQKEYNLTLNKLSERNILINLFL